MILLKEPKAWEKAVEASGNAKASITRKCIIAPQALGMHQNTRKSFGFLPLFIAMHRQIMFQTRCTAINTIKMPMNMPAGFSPESTNSSSKMVAVSNISYKIHTMWPAAIGDFPLQHPSLDSTTQQQQAPPKLTRCLSLSLSRASV